MKNLPDLLANWLLALWVGGTWAIGYLAAPVLFSALGDKMLAGHLAGEMFKWMAVFGVAAAIYLLIFRFNRFGSDAFKQGFFWLVLLMLLITLAGRFGIQPILEQLKGQALPQDVMHSLVRDRFQTWHGVSSVLYLIQSVLGLVLVTKANSR
ncbi:MAG: DUF4149 domain-containing protein [Betaproteobacteria bacterium]|nr:DUF4149 domain-containing protein [Betaproteobacteria bacterium]